MFVPVHNSSKLNLQKYLHNVCDVWVEWKVKAIKLPLLYGLNIHLLSSISFTVSNKGEVQLDYQWHFQPIGKAKTVTLAERLGSEPARPASSLGQSVSQQTGRPSTSAGASSIPAHARAPPLAPRPGSSMGGRPSSALALAYEAGSVVSEEGSDIFPFVIEPESGSIPAGKKGSFVVKFSPLDVSEYEAMLTLR